MAAIFKPGANLAAKLGLSAATVMVLGGIAWWWGWPRTDYRRNDFWFVDQVVQPEFLVGPELQQTET